MSVSDNLRRVIEANARLWAGEAEVVRTYFNAPGRTRESDRQWLARQCFKEIWGSSELAAREGLYLGPLRRLLAVFPKTDIAVDRHEVFDIAEGFWAEFAHYVAFADAHDAMAMPGEPKLSPKALKTWQEDEDLTELRRRHKREHGIVGERAAYFTEGGYCTLFSEGARLAPDGAGGRNRAIVEACKKVYDDEFGHMLKGIVGIDEAGLSAEQWRAFEAVTVEQLRGRIRMRNAQFGFPLAEKRVQEIYRGEIEPIAFDYGAARLALAA